MTIPSKEDGNFEERIDTVSELYSSLICNVIDSEIKGIKDLIVVVQGDVTLVNLGKYNDYITDLETFKKHGNNLLFTKKWFGRIFSRLTATENLEILSYAQFSYLVEYLSPDYFNERVLIVKDNLRQIFPIDQQDYLIPATKENIELRPDELPIYQAEQMAINGVYYYAVKSIVHKYRSVDIFKETRVLERANKKQLETIDVSSDPLALDKFINQCLTDNCFNKDVNVRYYSKQPANVEIIENLRRLNYLMQQFGGRLYLAEEAAVDENFIPKDSTVTLLTKYWGKEASFRTMPVYKNPNIDNEISEVSQGLIVETIIQEYENSCTNKVCRDLFLTAPTGSGKSLLFQLPAFYISEKGGFTIIVSPLIALMKDQVNAILQERSFEKVAYINSELSLIDRDRIIESCKAGEVDILYLSPELLLSYDVTYFIGSRKLSLVVVDEAHLITTWGRDFRVDYWFLGNHIRKIRDYNKISFPMIAVTATAIYGGTNDMVFDSIQSLVMNDPFIYIGQVRRHDIEFLINNYDRFPKTYESSKISQTIDFIKKINSISIKTLVYAPYTKHITSILTQLNSENLHIATGYHGRLDSLNKEFAYRQFKSGEVKIMISTKAFGMGVDISDIQLVYHHAPSGLLPDYIQEIGRVARKPELNGYAALNYTTQDQRYTKALHGMSAIRQYQLQEVLKKLYKSYVKNGNKRNLLLSVDDFGYIFQTAQDLDQKVLTALMMIEKDYLAKHRFNVILARPKKLFVKVFARLTNSDFTTFSMNYHNLYSIVDEHNNGFKVIELDLDQLWLKKYSDKSFPIIKKDFFTGALFRNDNITVVPQIKISFQLLSKYNEVLRTLNSLFNTLQSIFSKMKKFFDKVTFQNELDNYLKDKSKAERLSKFVLSSYSGRLIAPGVIEPDSFLQERRTVDGYEYRVFSNQYLANFSSLIRKFTSMFENSSSALAERYVTNNETNAVNYVRLGYFLQILDIANFEIKGGENPMVYVRINDPTRIQFDSINKKYSNTLLTSTLQKHDISSQIFDHFFLNNFTNTERWDYIEDFFLGMDVDSLIRKYSGGNTNSLDIIEELKKKVKKNTVNRSKELNSNPNIFFPVAGKIYYDNDLLTIKDEDKHVRTMHVSDWVIKEPVLLHKTIKKNKIRLNYKLFTVLLSKLSNKYPDYYKRTLGLNMKIKFSGYDQLVEARIPYIDQPVKFFKWWLKNKDKVHLSETDIIILLDKVKMLS